MSGWLAQTCAIRPRNAQQRRIQFNPHRVLCDDQTCWIGNTRTNQQSGTTRWHSQEDDDESQQGYAWFRQSTGGIDSRRTLAKLPSLRSMGSRRTGQTYCIRKGCKKLAFSSCTAENHEQVNANWDGMAGQDWSVSRRTQTASVKRNHATPCSSVFPLIVYVRAVPQNYMGISLHAHQRFCTSRNWNSDTTRFHRRSYFTRGTTTNYWRWSEPTQTMNAEKRKVDETAKDSRAPLPITASSRASSSRPDDETHKQLTARITRRELRHLKMSAFWFFKRGWSTCAEEMRRECWWWREMKGNSTLHSTSASQGRSCGCFAGTSSTRGECSSKDVRRSFSRLSLLACQGRSGAVCSYKLCCRMRWAKPQRVHVDDITALVMGRNKTVAEMVKKVMKRLREEVVEKRPQIVSFMNMERKERVRWLRRVSSWKRNAAMQQGRRSGDGRQCWSTWSGLENKCEEVGRERKSETEEVQGEILDHSEEQGLSEELHEGWGQEVATSGHGASKDVESSCRGDGSHMEAAAGKKSTTSLSLFMEPSGLKWKKSSLRTVRSRRTLFPERERRVAWETQMSFSMQLILWQVKNRANSQMQVARLIPCSGWTLTKRHICEEMTICLRTCRAHKGRWIGYGYFGTMEGLRADPLAGNVDSHKIFCSWFAQAHVPIHSCDFTKGSSPGHGMGRTLLYHVVQELRSWTLCCKNSWLAKKNTRQRITLDEYNRLPTGYGLTREATASKEHQRRFASRFLAWIGRQIRPDLSYHNSKIQSSFENASCFLLENLSWSRLHFWSSSSKSRMTLSAGSSRNQFFRILSSSGHHCSIDYFAKSLLQLLRPKAVCWWSLRGLVVIEIVLRIVRSDWWESPVRLNSLCASLCNWSLPDVSWE